MAEREAARARRFVSRSPEATEALAERIGAALDAGAVIALRGELGAGKTCFVRGLARGLGIDADVASPTFALMSAHEGRLPLYHFDAWMEGREKALFLEGGDEWLHGGGVAAVEWADRVEPFLPRPHLAVELAHESERARRIAIEVRGEGERADAWRTMLGRLALPDGIEEDS